MIKANQLLAFLLAVLCTSHQVLGFAVSSSNLERTGGACRSNGSSSLQMTIISYNGKKKDFKAGSPLSKAVEQLGVKPRYSCKK
jgi:hypothetical protein